jgi:hypothetical protein
MSTSVSQAFATRFTARVHHLGQQRMSRLRNCVYSENDRANLFRFERLASEDMVSTGSRHDTITPLNIAHSYRIATAETWDWTELVDRRDAVRILQNAGQQYVKAAAMAHGRAIDRIIATAIESDSKTQDGSGAVALPASQLIGDGTGKMTLELLRNAKELLDAAEVSEPGLGERYLALNAKALRDLLEVTEVTSSDYNSVKALVQGELNAFMGFNVIRTEILPAASGTVITGDNTTGVGCLAWERDCVGLAIADDKFTRVGENPERKFSLEIYTELTMGGARIEDEGVVVIDIAP